MNDRLEEQLRSSLDRQAGLHPASGPDLADVFGRARRIRRRRTATVAGVAAAAVLAVIVPTAVVLGDHGSSDRGIAPATSSPTPSAAGDSRAATSGLAGIPLGEPTRLTYLDPHGGLHGYGIKMATRGTRIAAFASYHGGWIIAYNDNTIAEVPSNSGIEVRHGRGGTIVVSSDGTQTAWQIGDTLYSGASSGTGETESTWQLKKDEGLYGYLADGPMVSSGDHGYAILTAGGGRIPVSSDVYPQTASSAANLVGGSFGTPAKNNLQGAVVDGSTGAMLWHNEWLPMAFSPDGKYVAGRPVAENGDPSAFAILDARTGAVVAQTPPSIAGKVYLSGNVVWDTDDHVVFQGTEASGPHAALFSLGIDGSFDQVSPTVLAGPPPGFVLITR